VAASAAAQATNLVEPGGSDLAAVVNELDVHQLPLAVGSVGTRVRAVVAVRDTDADRPPWVGERERAE
jgi:hypothetical protein